jgi:hypothetical protein
MVLKYTKYYETMKTPFEIGDRVIVIMLFVGKKGTIICYERPFYGVEFDENLGLHDCKNMGKMGHCYYIHEHKLKKMDIEKIKEEDIEWF